MELLNNGVCVKECPTSSGPVHCKPTKAMEANWRYKNCEFYPLAKEEMGTIYWLEPFRYNTKSMLGAFCMPYDDTYVNKDTFEAFKKAFFETSTGAASA